MVNFSDAETLELKHVNITPGAAGEKEAITLAIDADKEFTSTTYMAIRTKDESGNSGEVSNIVSILVAVGYKATAQEYVPRPTTEATTVTTTTERVIANTTTEQIIEKMTTEQVIYVTTSKQVTGGSLVPVLVAVLAVILVLTVVTIGIFVIKRKKCVNLGNGFAIINLS